ncbi:MAG: ABC transporter permease [Bacteroidales bacterium]|nr:ABC transporter permease [Bacteroidales bacterium]
MRDLLQEIWESLRRNKVRTCLTGLAVAWGIFMLIVLLGAGNGLLNAFLNDSEGFASNTIQVGGGRTSKPYDGLKQGRRIRITDKDLDILRQPPFSDKVDVISTGVSRSGYTMTYGRRYLTNVSLNGTLPGDAEVNRVKMVAGRFINEKDIADKRKVVIITHLHAKNFLVGGTDYDKLVGKRVKVGNLSFTIIGVRHAEENTDDRSLYVPYTTVRSMFGLGDEVDEITFSFHGLNTEAESEAFENQVRASFNAAHRAAPDDRSALWVWNRFTQNLQMEKGKKLLVTALWIIGLFTLVSGIVGVSNIMLITVKERTHEFGIRKALGARPGSILKLIVTESVLITAFFGYIGMLLGMVACEILNATVGQSKVDLFGESIKMLDNPTVGLGTALGATVVLIVAGTIAGIFPANQAARVKPIEALRAE